MLAQEAKPKESLRSPSTGGGGGAIPTVKTLPAIPTSDNRNRIVKWTSEGAGTGDDQKWGAQKGDTKWHPMEKFTDKDGTPA